MARPGVVAIFADHLHTGRAPKLYGHGKPTRDYVYVSDVVSALLAASGRSGTYNIATGVETDVMGIWTGLSEAAGAEIDPELADLRPGELQHSCLDTSHAAAELGWRAEVTHRRGAWPHIQGAGGGIRSGVALGGPLQFAPHASRGAAPGAERTA